ADFDECVGEPEEVRVAERRHLLPQRRSAVAKRGERSRVSRRELVPRVLRMSEVLARGVELGRILAGLVLAFGRRNALREVVRLLDLAHEVARRLCARHVIQNLAHQALGDARCAFAEALDLLLDAIAKRLAVQIRRQRALRERVEERERPPPERALSAGALADFDRLDCGAHVFGAAPIFLQPLEEAALVPASLLPQGLLGVPGLEHARAPVTPRRTE